MVTRWMRLVTSLIFTLFTYGTDARKDRPCAPIDGKNYNCVKSTECTFFSQRLREPFLAETLEMMTRARCGFENSIPKVCCPEKFKCGIPKPKPRVSGGSFADIGEYPWMALLIYKIGNEMSFRCAGTLINERFVLTAAHCITADLFGVTIGEHDTSTRTDCITFFDEKYCSEVQDFLIKRVIRHKEYSSKNYDNDIGLIELKKPVNLSRENAGIICLPVYPNLRDLSLTGKNMTAAGWGATEYASRSNVLKKVTIPVIDNEECKTYFDYEDNKFNTTFLNPQKMCAGEQHKDSCQGDSGGPLMHFTNYENRIALVQFGIVSFGKNTQCSDGNWGVYTKVTEYVDWILENMQLQTASLGVN